MKTMAIDLDDVIAANVPAFIDFSNKRWGTALTIEDYDEHWTAMWNVDHEEGKRRALEFHASGIVNDYGYDVAAKQVLKKLKKEYKLVIVTSRQKLIEKETLAWIDKHFKGMFDDIRFAGIWDDGIAGSHKVTKAEVIQQIGGDYLIDDQLKHCLAVAEAGVPTLLFGDYSWNQTDLLPDGVIRTHDWQAVAEYFNV